MATSTISGVSYLTESLFNKVCSIQEIVQVVFLQNIDKTWFLFCEKVLFYALILYTLYYSISLFFCDIVIKALQTVVRPGQTLSGAPGHGARQSTSLTSLIPARFMLIQI